ncbi:hypothetical protein BP5796_12234 [Coleophoma crateriformis]|uniref:Heterokaryon incompatibility domain-containing protein n=1 Tax=Coleophoma crateriformis TaxID=565419 RepID=A0A3D8QA19_9HELO|nr:hypothetical protein BP5796_12234 [Coleophoma crateriformis]
MERPNPFDPLARGKARVVVYRSAQEQNAEKDQTGSILSPRDDPKDIRDTDTHDYLDTVPFPASRDRHSESHPRHDLSLPDDLFNLENPSTTVWPMRLLHAKTMTAYTRMTEDGSACYRSPEGITVVEPSYNILSYTWGRFELRGDSSASSLQVRGIKWRVPSIDANKAFSVDEFRDLLQQIAGEDGFVWVDVACIDQRNDSEEKKVEIGRQVGIFYRAQSAYIWLHQLSKEDLQKGIDAISYAKEARNATANDTRCIETMCQDPWFSSLWTLQEAYLRKSAILLSKTGGPVFTSPGTYATLQWVLEACGHPWAHATGYIKNVVHTAGLDRISARNPVVLLAAARYRQTSRPLDRVQGIMQVFGLNIGSDIPEPRLSQLEVELSKEINKKSPALAQAFINVDPVAADQAWRLQVGAITPAKRNHRDTFQRPGLDFTQIVPADFFHALEMTTYHKRAKITFTGDIPTFQGFSFPLESLLAMWEMELPDDQENPQLDNWMPYMNHLTHSIYMDNVNGITDTNKLRLVPFEEAFLKHNRPLILAQDLATHFPDQIRRLDPAAAQAVAETFGRLDVLINNAGFMTNALPIVDSVESEYWRTFEVNLRGVYLVTKAYLPLLLGGLKTVLNVNSVAAHNLRPEASAYGTSKLAVLILTEFLMVEGAPKGLLAYSVHPGAIMTKLAEAMPQSTFANLTHKPEMVADTIVSLTQKKRD